MFCRNIASRNMEESVQSMKKSKKKTENKKLWKGLVLVGCIALLFVTYQFKDNPEVSQVTNMIWELLGVDMDGSASQPTNQPTSQPTNVTEESLGQAQPQDLSQLSLGEFPEYSGDGYIVVNGNVPYFETKYLTTESYEYYSELDELGRCGPAYACLGKDLMPTEERGSISSVKPSGWQSVKYDCVSGGNLYNRCHLIGFQLAGENANKKNLITGTRYLNVESMLIFENMVADYITETGNHVMYRIWPVFEGDNLVASGVLMEGWSIEDQGEGICFNVYAYNIQPGIEIDYATGESKEIKE